MKTDEDIRKEVKRADLGEKIESFLFVGSIPVGIGWGYWGYDESGFLVSLVYGTVWGGLVGGSLGILLTSSLKAPEFKWYPAFGWVVSLICCLCFRTSFNPDDYLGDNINIQIQQYYYEEMGEISLITLCGAVAGIMLQFFKKKVWSLFKEKDSNIN